MATTTIISLHGHKGKTIAQTIADRIDYSESPDKTEDGKFISAYECSPESAASEFDASKTIYAMMTGRERAVTEDVIAYMIRQSFKPGEVTPQEANEIGYALALEFTKGEHQFIVATHTNKAHIHNHVIFNSTTLDCERKFDNYHQCGRDVRKISDRLCEEHDLSVIRNPRQKGQSYKEWDARRTGQSWKAQLQDTIDWVLPDSRDIDDFLAKMRTEGYEVKLGKNIAFRAAGQERFTRAKVLGADYTEDAMKQRIKAPRGRVTAPQKPARRSSNNQVNLLIDIQAKLQAGKGSGYEKWSKIFNLKEAAKTLNFLSDHNISDYEELALKTEEAGKRFDVISSRLKKLDARLAEIVALKTHIINYSKTRETYVEYGKSRHKKEFRAAHESELGLHEAAKRAFDALDGKSIPKVAQLQEEYTALLSEKKAGYEEYKALRKEMLEYGIIKQNIDRILSVSLTAPDRRNQPDR